MGLVLMISALIELIVVSPDHQPWSHLLPKNDEELKLELSTALLRYLGIGGACAAIS